MPWPEPARQGNSRPTPVALSTIQRPAAAPRRPDRLHAGTPPARRSRAPGRRDRSATPAAIALASSPQLPPQPRSRELPVAHHSLRRDPQHGRGLFYAETTEETQLDDAASPLVEPGERRQRLVECHEILGFVRHRQRVGERHLDRIAASLLI